MTHAYYFVKSEIICAYETVVIEPIMLYIKLVISLCSILSNLYTYDAFSLVFSYSLLMYNMHVGTMILVFLLYPVFVLFYEYLEFGNLVESCCMCDCNAGNWV